MAKNSGSSARWAPASGGKTNPCYQRHLIRGGVRGNTELRSLAKPRVSRRANLQTGAILLAVRFVFHVPFERSLVLLLAVMFLFVLANLCMSTPALR